MWKKNRKKCIKQIVNFHYRKKNDQWLRLDVKSSHMGTWLYDVPSSVLNSGTWITHQSFVIYESQDPGSETGVVCNNDEWFASMKDTVLGMHGATDLYITHDLII